MEFTLPTIFNDEADLRKLVDQAGERGVIAESQREMMQSVLDLGQTLVRELMVPRTDICLDRRKSNPAPRIITSFTVWIHSHSSN
ncbi:MAG: hypothetical protein WDN07_01475 [Actinomycetota bacterium]